MLSSSASLSFFPSLSASLSPSLLFSLVLSISLNHTLSYLLYHSLCHPFCHSLCHPLCHSLCHPLCHSLSLSPCLSVCLPAPEGALYNIHSESLKVKRRIAMSNISHVSTSRLRDNFFVIHVPTEYDYVYVSEHKVEIMTLLQKLQWTATGVEMPMHVDNVWVTGAQVTCVVCAMEGAWTVVWHGASRFSMCLRLDGSARKHCYTTSCVRWNPRSLVMEFCGCIATSYSFHLLTTRHHFSSCFSGVCIPACVPSYFLATEWCFLSVHLCIIYAG